MTIGHDDDNRDSFQASRYLLGLLLQAKRDSTPCRIRHALLGEILIDPQQKRYLAPRADLEGLSKVPANRLQISPLNEGGLGGSGRDLDELLWTAAWHASAGRLPEDCHRHDVVELTRWPNLSRLPGGADIMRLCALLSRSAHGLTLARRLLDVSEEDANRFYSAALYSGLLRQISRNAHEVEAPAIPADSADSGAGSKLGQTLRALWKRLKGA